jgi:hypothetical protein
LSALSRLTKLPSCTDQLCPAVAFAVVVEDVGSEGAISTGVGAADAAGADAGGTAAGGAGTDGTADDGAAAAGAAPDGDAVLEAVAADAAEASSGDGSGALLVARSTVTLRTGCGALTGNRAVAGMGTGPDSSSGTTNTMSTAKIEAPTKRSLTRRSIACQP